MRYGVPYKGSKNSIAKEIVDFLPKADTFYDLFAGGCAVSHAAMQSGKYKKIVMNDINPMPTQLFVDALDGKYKDEKRWISREDFFRLKDIDPFVRYCFSFNNDGETYIYGKDIEEFKHGLHLAIFEKDTRLLESETGIKDIPNFESVDDAPKRYSLYRNYLKTLFGDDEMMIASQSYERLKRLNGIRGG